MLEDPAERAAVPASDDQDAARCGVAQQRHVDEHLVVEELVPFRGLHGSVEHERAPERRVVVDVDVLERRVLRVEQIARVGELHAGRRRFREAPLDHVIVSVRARALTRSSRA